MIHQDELNYFWAEKAKMQLGGGLKNIQKQHDRGRLTARERLAFLIDEGSELLEIGTFVGHEMYEEHGGCPAGGTVGGIGRVSGRLCMLIANDQTVKAGAYFPITAKKNLRLQEIAIQNHLPVVYLVDSAGVYLPMQDEIFPDKEHFGRVFYNNSILSAKGITQISAVIGSCVAGGAYLPIMSDETLMVENQSSIFLAGPYLVKAALGEEIDGETLGGAVTHTEISGIADYKFKTEQECLAQVQRNISKLNNRPLAGFDRIEAQNPQKNPDEIFDFLPENRQKNYNMLEIIQRLVDDSEFDEYKKDYGKTMLCGYARIDGWAVGIVANQRLMSKNAKGEMQIGGVIYNDSADKSARFILNCNQKGIPLIFLQDVTGFMVGSRSEHSGIAKDGAKMINAVSNSIVPKITIIVGNSYGAGNYAMCGKAFDPRFIFAWPSAKIAVMGGQQAAQTLVQANVASAKAKGKPLTSEEEAEMLAKTAAMYDRQASPYYAAARLWVDEIIEPKSTRKIISTCIETANLAPFEKDFKTGVFQV